MKRAIVTTLLIVFVLTTFASVYASSLFVPSVSFDSTPEIIVTDKKDDKEIISDLKDKDGNKIEEVTKGSIIITSVIDVKEGNHSISQESADKLIDTYNQLTSSDIKLSGLIPDLKDSVKEELGEDADVDDLVISGLYDISATHNDLKENIKVEGNTVTLTFKMPIRKNAYFNAVVQTDKGWQPVKSAVNNGDGTVTVTFDQLGTVMFLTDPVKGDEEPRPVGHIHCCCYWILLAISILLLLVNIFLVIYIVRLKKKDNQDGMTNIEEVV